MQEGIRENRVAQTILDVAQELFQERGYRAFSYRDLSREVGIKTSSIHYYFPTKEDLAKVLTVRYREHFNTALSQINTQTDDPKKKLDLYMNLFLNSFRACKRICLCSMLASDFANLPETVRQEIRGIFADNETWLAKVLEAGRKAKVFRFEGTPELKARAVFSALEGATVSARTFGDEKRLSDVADWIQGMLK